MIGAGFRGTAGWTGKRAGPLAADFAHAAPTLWGCVQMYVHDTGRDMMELGVIPAANMPPEVAYVKPAWVPRKNRRASGLWADG